MKPVGKSQGTGIFMVTKLAQVLAWKPVETSHGTGHGSTHPHIFSRKGHQEEENNDGQSHQEAEAYIIQRYIENPHTAQFLVKNSSIAGTEQKERTL